MLCLSVSAQAEQAAAGKATDTTSADKAAAEKTAADKAAGEQAAGEKIVAIKIVAIKIGGNHRIETAAVLQAVRLKAGDVVTPDKVDADIRAIYKLGHFTDVKAQSETKDGGVVLEYVVTEKPIVREVKIEGAKELSTDKVREAIEIKPNSVFSPKDLQKSVKKVKKLYADEGYYLAEVSGDLSMRSDTDVHVIFRIKEGDKVLIEKIEFEGNRAFPDKKLKKTMETGEKWFLSWLTGAGTYKEEVLKNDVNLLTEYYMNNGYVNVKVGEPKVELLPDRKGLRVSIGITEGEQYRIGKLGFKGELLETETVLNGKLKEKPGQLFSRADLRSDVFGLTDLYADKGYAFANANPLTKLNADSHTIDITFDMEKGQKVTIDRINITGNVKTRDKVVRRELKLDEGDQYSSTALKKSKQNLMNTGFFEEANLATAKGSTADKLDINVEVKEKPTGTFSIGAGYSSLDGIIGQGSVQQANFLGLGLKATAAASLGSKSQTYNLGLTDPYFMDTKWTLGGDIYRNERQYLDYTRRATGGDIKAGYPLSDTVSTFWLYKYEIKDIFDESPELRKSINDGAVLEPEKKSTTSAVIASISRNTTDYRLDPSIGMMNSLSIEFAGLGGSNRYVKYITENTLFHPLFYGVGSVRGTLGYVQSYGGKEIPIDEKFYLGGISSLRGFSSRTVSPFKTTTVFDKDANGYADKPKDNRVYLGGSIEAVANVEWTFPLLKDAGLKGVLFFDAGNSDNSFDKTFGTVLTSYGGGIRWYSPIGPLRLEYGVPINPREGIDNKKGKFEFSIGSIF
ncbi:outer membrane protein assembly factor BamA [Geomonas sp. Red259]|uniref:Outer membrane protein assembly factor BamA n=2 Tax=Geomonas propionica TaxID=2798582 RepID=A0ABS0YUP0_9BACT|nr:outer membrane protein assembly factor BamA [Geomonas propionica]